MSWPIIPGLNIEAISRVIYTDKPKHFREMMDSCFNSLASETQTDTVLACPQEMEFVRVSQSLLFGLCFAFLGNDGCLQ